jgi:hypothetical protein
MIPLQVPTPDPPNMPLSIILGLLGIVLALKGLVTILRESRPSTTDSTPSTWLTWLRDRTRAHATRFDR